LDLAEPELAQIAVIENSPAQLSEAEVEAVIKLLLKLERQVLHQWVK
jgi:uncharacterized protein YqeY